MIITSIVLFLLLAQFVTAALQTGVCQGRALHPMLICGHAVSSSNVENFFVGMHCEVEERRSRLLMSDYHLYLLELNAGKWE